MSLDTPCLVEIERLRLEVERLMAARLNAEMAVCDANERGARDAKAAHALGFAAGVEAAAKVVDDLAAYRVKTLGNPYGDPVEWLLKARETIRALAASVEAHGDACPICKGKGEVTLAGVRYRCGKCLGLGDNPDMSDEEVDAFLRANGIDPDAAYERLRKRIKERTGHDLPAQPVREPPPSDTPHAEGYRHVDPGSGQSAEPPADSGREPPPERCACDGSGLVFDPEHAERTGNWKPCPDCDEGKVRAHEEATKTGRAAPDYDGHRLAPPERCPECGGTGTRHLVTYDGPGRPSIRTQHVCPSCGGRGTTAPPERET